MTLNEKLKKVQEIRNKISKLYIELNTIKSDIVKDMVESDKQKETIDIDSNYQATLVWAVEKKIDYEKLMESYPDIYILGLKNTFSSTQALNSISSNLLNKVLKDCYKTNMGYELEFKKRRRK